MNRRIIEAAIAIVCWFGATYLWTINPFAAGLVTIAAFYFGAMWAFYDAKAAALNITKRIIHCDTCGDSYFDSGVSVGCPHCKLAAAKGGK